jgi:hemoglobin
MAEAPTMYTRVGGRAFFERLVDEFYDGVAGDEALAAIYPEHPDFSGARHRLTMFLVQYWGGPADYAAERGQPKLRLRHMRFPIDAEARDRWLTHMRHAVEVATADLDGGAEIADELLAYFRPTAEHMRNDTGLPITSTEFRQQD